MTAVEFKKMRNGYIIYHNNDCVVGSVLKSKGKFLLRIDEYLPIADIKQILSKMKQLQREVNNIQALE